MDFKAKLAERRAKEALDKQLKKVKSDSAPNLNPWTARAKKEVEPPPPDLSELNIPAGPATKLGAMVIQHAEIGKQIGMLSKEKETITEGIKALCKIYKLAKFSVNGNRNSYYKIQRESISRELLLANGVSADAIKESTVVTESWSFRSGRDSGD